MYAVVEDGRARNDEEISGMSANVEIRARSGQSLKSRNEHIHQTQDLGAIKYKHPMSTPAFT